MKLQVEIKNQTLIVRMNGEVEMVVGGIDHDQTHETEINPERIK